MMHNLEPKIEDLTGFCNNYGDTLMNEEFMYRSG